MLEVQTQAELNQPLAARRRLVIAAGAQFCPAAAKDRVVEEVEELCPEQQIDAFPNCRRLSGREVKVVQELAADGIVITRCVAEQHLLLVVLSGIPALRARRDQAGG